MSTLPELMQALPTELFDEILDLTFTTEEEVRIDEEYRPPPQLQVDRASRNAILKRYYSTTTFTIDFDPTHNLPVLLAAWLTSIREGDRDRIETIHLNLKRERVSKSVRDKLFVGKIDLELVHTDLWREWGVVLNSDTFHIPMRNMEDSGERPVWLCWTEIIKAWQMAERMGL